MKLTIPSAFVLATVAVLGLSISQTRADLIPSPSPEYSIETDKLVYDLGEQVHATHRITNPDDQLELNIGLLCEPGFDLWVLHEQNKIWSNYTFFMAVVWTLTLDPGESVEYEYTWDMTDFNGIPVGPGQYEIVGKIYGGGQNVSTDITIVPEPGTLILLSGAAPLILLKIRRKR